MLRTTVTVQQIASPIRRNHAQRTTLIGLGLNRIGRVRELPDNAETRGMIAKVAHLVRVIGQKTELDCFVEAVRAEYYDAIITGIVRGDVLWRRFEEAVTSCRADPKRNHRSITECVNELAVAKLLLEDPTITGTITYEPDILPDGRKIDFVVDRGADNLYIEVKTVSPSAADTDEAWERFLEREKHHPENVKVLLGKDWMGGAIYANLFASRSKFLEYTRDFESRLATAKAIKQGPGVLIFCGNGFAWHKSNLEDFVDFYLDGVHRGDDPFRLMEEHYIGKNKIELLRNIDHFAFLRRHVESPRREEFHFPIRGPLLILPPPQPLTGR